MENYRPIALCNVFYKIRTKILASRLRNVLDLVISHHQTAFILGRSINDNTILFHEIMHYVNHKKGNKGFTAIKIDLAKAYDRVDWCFLKHVMIAHGFPSPLHDLIYECVSTPSYSFLINGSFYSLLKSSRGIRQFDPKFPALFTLAFDVLSRLLAQTEANENLYGVKFSRESPSISHLIYADDLVIFSRADEQDAKA